MSASVIQFRQHTESVETPAVRTVISTKWLAKCWHDDVDRCPNQVVAFIVADQEIRHDYAMACAEHIEDVARWMTSAPGDDVPVTVYRITS